MMFGFGKKKAISEQAGSVRFEPWSSVFNDRETANEVVRAALKQHADVITKHIGDGTLRQYSFEVAMDEEVGVVAEPGQEPKPTKLAVMVLHESNQWPEGFYLYTAFPKLSVNQSTERVRNHGSKPLERLVFLMYYDGGTVDEIIKQYISHDDPDGKKLASAINELLKDNDSNYDVGVVIADIAGEPVNSALHYRAFLEATLAKLFLNAH